MRFAYWAKRFTGARRAERPASTRPPSSARPNPPRTAAPPGRPCGDPAAGAGGTIHRWPKESFPSPIIAISRPCRDTGDLAAPTGLLRDRLGRPLHDLRISVTDRCNFRCSYCMPKEIFDEQYAFLPHSSLFSFEEIARLAALFVAHGVRKIRLTGGEPLLRETSSGWSGCWPRCARPKASRST